MGRFSKLARWTAGRFVPALRQTVHCSACGREKAAVVHLVAGPGVYLCNYCFEQAATQLAARRPPPDAKRCRFCRQLRATGDVTTVGNVLLCADCLGLMDMMLAEAAQRSGPATSDR
jgi:hypothetical protein